MFKYLMKIVVFKILIVLGKEKKWLVRYQCRNKAKDLKAEMYVIKKKDATSATSITDLNCYGMYDE